MFLQVLNMCVAWPKFPLCEVCVFDFVLVVFLDDVVDALHNICCGCVCLDKGDILVLRKSVVVCYSGWPSRVVVV